MIKSSLILILVLSSIGIQCTSENYLKHRLSNNIANSYCADLEQLLISLKTQTDDDIITFFLWWAIFIPFSIWVWNVYDAYNSN